MMSLKLNEHDLIQEVVESIRPVDGECCLRLPPFGQGTEDRNFPCPAFAVSELVVYISFHKHKYKGALQLGVCVFSKYIFITFC